MFTIIVILLWLTLLGCLIFWVYNKQLLMSVISAFSFGIMTAVILRILLLGIV